VLSKHRVPEGTWFSVPLRGGCVATGVVARSSPGLGVLVAYFFGPPRSAPVTLEQAFTLKPQDAVLVARVGTVGITRGAWPLVGLDPAFDRAQWPVPPFVRSLPRGPGCLLVRYDDEDPRRVVDEQPLPAPPPGRTFRDGLTGHLVVEMTLDKMLAVS
jgi:hypothetical protein